MRRESTRRNGWKKIRALSTCGALAAGLLFLPAATTPAEAHGRHRVAVVKPGHAHGHRHYHGHRHRAPIRVVYHRAHYHRPVYTYLPTPFVVVHGPRVEARVVAYPASAPVVYEPGYCRPGVHYHPYVPAPRVRGGISVRIGF